MRTKWLGLIALGALAWGWSVSAATNYLLDNATPHSVEIKVAKKHHSTDNNPSYYLDVAPLEDRKSPLTLTVSPQTYQQKAAGDTVTLCEHPGFLNAHWVTVSACDRSS